MEQADLMSFDESSPLLIAPDLTPETFCEMYAERIYKFAQMISTDSRNAEDLA